MKHLIKVIEKIEREIDMILVDEAQDDDECDCTMMEALHLLLENRKHLIEYMHEKETEAVTMAAKTMR